MKKVLENSKKIAILGLSPDAQKPSNKVAKYLQDKGYSIIPIYPKGGKILGIKAYTSLQDAFSQETDIDLLNVFRKSEALLEVAQEVLSLPYLPKCVWVQLGLNNKEAKELLENAGITYFEDACIKIEHQRIFQ
ncbi:CoA-binding protein [Helicobacter winghamensis]|uniref:CoA-binding protein n=1 Tax=Helicobacter winghamensis TaxID=157268 RepID=A0A2N3PHJ2_9HELI|nr:CoA-binding protein [Helicobacter winghamensis]EEO26463.1 CoA-binding domain protein [Helicobacter winghamensis ATCC BAA-430]PKT75480.1 CoA-binding protein [Helicobacter winghamensis]PKT75648.1 CoA-binding protein [Helicobacter winghamensis]PKT75857.1 CoA-binding protein [Helicobacter winghamensis]PKT79945.1 CoA-binding protein [Helicobacter winghamensis]